jgi:hypothetical protein
MIGHAGCGSDDLYIDFRADSVEARTWMRRQARSEDLVYKGVTAYLSTNHLERQTAIAQHIAIWQLAGPVLSRSNIWGSPKFAFVQSIVSSLLCARR